MKKPRVPAMKYPLLLIYRIVGIIFRQDGRIAKRLPDYFPTYRSFFGELLNQFFRLMGMPRSFQPQGVILEPTNSCNLKCEHCSARINEEKRGFMEYDFYTHIIDSNPQITCLMLSRYGEPLLHPRIFDMITYAKRKGIYVFLYTNGTLLSEKMSDMILSSGLDEIFFSLEGTGEDYEKNRGFQYEKLKDSMEHLIRKKETAGSDIKIGINVAGLDGIDRRLDAVRREWGDKVTYVETEPLIGTKSSPRDRSCRTLWRNAVIRWDGIVFPCCIDMNSSLAIGDAKKNTLKEIFNGPEALSLRRRHLEKRFPSVCKTCDKMFG